MNFGTIISDKTIAVLPFVNLSANEENEYFSDGITEEIINALAKIGGLKVTSRTSAFHFKGKNIPIREIGKELGVSTLLEGSIRLSGNAIRITAQLIDAAEDFHFWSETWDRKLDDVFQVQDEISLLIAERLREHFGHFDIQDHLVEVSTESLDAYKLVLKGRHHFYKWNPEDTNSAIGYFEKAIEIDPDLIEAYLGIADGYSFLAVAGFAPRDEAWQKNIEALVSAKKIDPDHFGLNYMLGFQSFFIEGYFTAALTYGLRSLAAKPNYSEAHLFVSYLYLIKGELKKAKEHLHFAKSSDPLNPQIRFQEANHYYRTGESSKAERILDELLEANKQNVLAMLVKTYVLIQKGNFETARNILDASPQETFAPDERLGLHALIDAKEGKVNAHLQELEDHAMDKEAHHAHSYLFLAYANLGRFDEAFSVLDKLFEANSSILLIGFSDPLAQPIKDDPRYAEYHQRIYPSVTPKQNIKNSKKADQTIPKERAEKIEAYVVAKQPFLNPSLSLRSLAEQIEMHPNQLSWLINESLGKNFNEYINGHRVQHFKRLSLDSGNSHISIIGLAYESGFNSKTAFNAYFKKAEGVTPKAWVRANQT